MTQNELAAARLAQHEARLAAARAAGDHTAIAHFERMVRIAAADAAL